MDDKKTIEYLKKLINEVKQESKSKKMLTEAKEPEEIFKNHKQKMKDYVSEKIFQIVQQAEK